MGSMVPNCWGTLICLHSMTELCIFVVTILRQSMFYGSTTPQRQGPCTLQIFGTLYILLPLTLEQPNLVWQSI